VATRRSSNGRASEREGWLARWRLVGGVRSSARCSLWPTTLVECRVCGCDVDAARMSNAGGLRKVGLEHIARVCRGGLLG
jgi:hypothetical protein